MITKFNIYENNKSAEDRFLFDYQKVPKETQEKLPYKIGDYIELHTSNFGGEPTGNPTLDIHDYFEIIFVRWYDDEKEDVVYGIKEIGASDDYYFETDKKYIVRKVTKVEIDAKKYNL